MDASVQGGSGIANDTRETEQLFVLQPLAYHLQVDG